MDLKFRLLRADEIDVRIGTISEKGASLLLYKDARCDMNILDETVGADKWQRSHEVINGNLFCNVSINVGGEWVCKQDVGTESYTEKEKGQASDSFKRACFNWGIGRELYTSPFIYIFKNNCNIEKKGSSYTCRDKFIVTDIDYKDRKISKLAISRKDKNSLIEVFAFPNADKKAREVPKQEAKPKPEAKPKSPADDLKDIRDNMYSVGRSQGFTMGDVTNIAIGKYKLKPMELSYEQLTDMIHNINTNAEALRNWLLNHSCK